MDNPPLSADELQRYARHIVLGEVGGAGQQKFKAARVLVIGAGGLGAPVALYLAAAGIGTLGIVDDDVVSLSNLQRQIIHSTKKIGAPKVESARETLFAINPHVNVVAHQVRMTAENARGLISGYDIVADGSDNFSTRYLTADVCAELKVPLVTAAVGRFDGSVTVLKPYEGENPCVPRYLSRAAARRAAADMCGGRNFGRADGRDRLAAGAGSAESGRGDWRATGGAAAALRRIGATVR